MKKFIAGGVLALVVILAAIYFFFPGLTLGVFMNLERGKANLAEKRVAVADHEIVYLEGGEGETLVLVHGYGGDKDNWTRFAAHLTPRYRVVAPDLPGFGESSKNPALSYDIAAQARRLGEFLDAIGEKKVHVAGNSMGGNIAGIFTAFYPGRVLTLGLLDTGGITEPVESEFRKNLREGRNSLVVESPEDYDRLIAFVFAKPPFIPRPLKRHFAGMAAASREFNEKVMEDIKARPALLEPLLGRLSLPVFVLWGDRDRVIDVSCVGVLKRGLPNPTTVIMKECGHLPMLERPGEAARHYLDFLEKTAAR
ncbi:MAG: alpha/beta fold hydrolase [Spirochaetes bacterium]|nr:alpha/beta fold hydrolase [Spirochaetota bacterium]